MDGRYIVSGPLVGAEIKLKLPFGHELLVAQLRGLADEDRSCGFSFDPESKLTLLKGVSEEHIDTLVEAVRARGFDVVLGAPQVLYRECVARTIEVDSTHKLQRGGGGEFARVVLRLEPGEPDADVAFENVAGAAVLREHLPGVAQALAACKSTGVLLGFPLIGFKATLLDGAYHEIDSSAQAFAAATRRAFQLAKNQRALALLEPVMAVEIRGLQQLHQMFADDLRKRRGEVMAERSGVRALVPLAGMLGYRDEFPSLSQGYGGFTMRYSHHQITSLGDDDPARFRPALAMRLRA